MNFSQSLNSEDDMRSKVIIPWLIGRGFDPNEIILEHSFSIRAGKGVFKIRNNEFSKCTEKDVSETIINSRADVLVRNSSGRNLFVIEVKSMSEPLNQAARDQGISYARLLEGNIAPFVVLTNGLDTEIFNTFTREKLNGSENLPDLVLKESHFFLGGDELCLRAEAIEALISLSPQNLHAFCQSQINCRMRLLRSDDLNSGRKYVPSLFVERAREKEKLHELLHKKNERVVLIVGSPQVGKTNFVCRMVEDRVAQGLPCLFYPAIGLKRGLFAEMAEDFEWIMNDHGVSGFAVVNKLRKVLNRNNQRLVVFVDGWNEASAEIVRALDIEGEQLSSAGIQIVVSLTSVAADRLLSGDGGNPSLLAQAARINPKAAELIAAKPDTANKEWSYVNIGKYSLEECNRAYEIYSDAYKVTIPENHVKSADPYALGAAMRLYQSAALPQKLDEPDLLEKVLREKYRRGVNLSDYELHSCLETIGGEIYRTDAPVEIARVSELWKLPIVKCLPPGFFEAALLAQVTNAASRPAVDFYYGKERDYVICYWLKRWHEKVKTGIDLSEEFAEVVQTETGTDALRWFFSQRKHITLLSSRANGILPTYENEKVNYILFYALCEIAGAQDVAEPAWLKYALDSIAHEQNNLVKIQAIKLVALLASDESEMSQLFEDFGAWEDTIAALFKIDKEYPLKGGGVGEIVVESLATAHRSWIEESELEETQISSALAYLMDDESEEVSRQAADCLAQIAPYAFFKYLAGLTKYYNPQKHCLPHEYRDNITVAAGGLTEFYYGSYCPGFLDSIEGDDGEKKERAEHYDLLSEALGPVIRFYPDKKTVQPLVDLLSAVKPNDNEPDFFVDRLTPFLPFGD